MTKNWIISLRKCNRIGDAFVAEGVLRDRLRTPEQLRAAAKREAQAAANDAVRDFQQSLFYRP